MTRTLFAAFTALILGLAACNPMGENQNAEVDTQDTIEIWLAELNEIDSSLLADETMNPEKGWTAFNAFRNFARKNPAHSLAPTYHMKAAAIARNIPGKALMAIEEYSEVYKNYPQDTLAPQAQFLVGFTFDQALNDGPRARKAYVAFVEAWPNHPLAAQAKDLIAIIDNTGTDLDQVKAWEKNQGQ